MREQITHCERMIQSLREEIKSRKEEGNKIKTENMSLELKLGEVQRDL